MTQLAASVASFEGVVRENSDNGVQDSIHRLHCDEVREVGTLINGHLHVDDAIVGIGEERVPAGHPVGQDHPAKLGHKARQAVHRDVRVDIGEPDLQKGVCCGPAINMAAAGGPPGDPPPELGDCLLEDGVLGEGDEEELLHLEHVDGRHCSGWQLHVLNDEGRAVSAVMARMNGLHIQQDRPDPGDMCWSRCGHRWRSGWPAAPAAGPIGGDIGVGSWGPLLLSIAPDIVMKIAVFHTIEIETTAYTTKEIFHSSTVYHRCVDVNRNS